MTFKYNAYIPFDRPMNDGSKGIMGSVEVQNPIASGDIVPALAGSGYCRVKIVIHHERECYILLEELTAEEKHTVNLLPISRT